MNDLILENLPLVKYVINRMGIYNKSDYDDYYQVGVIGLLNAAKTFNTNLKNSFSTYTFTYIKKVIIKCPLRREFI